MENLQVAQYLAKAMNAATTDPGVTTMNEQFRSACERINSAAAAGDERAIAAREWIIGPAYLSDRPRPRSDAEWAELLTTAVTPGSAVGKWMREQMSVHLLRNGNTT